MEYGQECQNLLYYTTELILEYTSAEEAWHVITLSQLIDALRGSIFTI